MTYLITRRCTQRQFWLLPCEQINQIVRYCAAYAAKAYGIQIHALCVVSNHWHGVLSDPEAQLPRFLHWFHLYVAKCVNAHHGRWENLWSTEQTSAVILTDDQDVLDKIAYCLANPVAAGLVREGTSWPGVRTKPHEVSGAEWEIARPSVLFRKNGPMPKTVILRLVRPAVCPELSDEELAARIDELVLEAEARARREHDEAGRSFLGLKGLARQKPWQRPSSAEQRRERSPGLSAKSSLLRRRMLAWLERFVKGHEESRRAWQAGMREVVFPAGTYAMRVFHGARCAPYAPP